MSRWSSLATVVAVIVVLPGSAWLVVGWGLGSSSERSQYGLAGYWTEADGVPLDQPYAIAVDPRSDHVRVTDAANQRFSGFRRTVLAFGRPGDGPGNLRYQCGDRTVGPIYVADFATKVV